MGEKRINRNLTFNVNVNEYIADNNIIIAKYLLKSGTCLLSKLIDTQVARRGRQYHRNPPVT